MSDVRYDEIGYWSEIKLDIVRNMRKRTPRFCRRKRGFASTSTSTPSPGLASTSRSRRGEFVPGSPLNALNVQPPFSEYHFIDFDGDKADHLRQLVGDDPSVSCIQ